MMVSSPCTSPSPLRSISLYEEIIAAIGFKSYKLKEICDITKTPQNIISKYLSILKDLEYIERETVITEKKVNNKNSLYRVKDNFFKFWFSFIYQNRFIAHLFQLGHGTAGFSLITIYPDPDAIPDAFVWNLVEF